MAKSRKVYVGKDGTRHVQIDALRGVYGRRNPRTGRADSLVIEPGHLGSLIRELLLSWIKGGR